MAYNTVKLEDVTWKESDRPVDPGHVKGLAASIEEVGLLEPIDVVDLGGGKYLGVAGRHRFEAVKSLGEKTIEAHVLDVDEEGQRIARFHENVKRADLNPLQRARAIRDYMEFRRSKDPNAKQEDVAKELQVSAAELSNTLRVLKMDVHIQKLLEDRQIAPGHIEHVLGPLEDKLPQEKLVRFAHDIARERLDVRTAKEQAKYVLQRHEGEVHRAKLDEMLKKAKARECPSSSHRSYRPGPDAFAEIQGRVVLSHESYGEPGHKWFADTGEFYLTPAETKELERRKTERERNAKLAAKAKGKDAEKREKTVRDFAVFFSRAPLAKWAQALLDAAKENLRDLSLGDYRSGGALALGNAHSIKLDGFPTMPKQEYGGELPVFLSAVEVPDGNAGKFLTRVQVGELRSTPSDQDNVAEGPMVSKIRKAREDLLAWQAKHVGVKQEVNDLWPSEIGGFKLGEKVRLGKTDWSSYVGKQGAVLAFDAEDGGKSLAAVLDIAAAHKVHDIRGLEKLTKEEKGTPKGRAK